VGAALSCAGFFVINTLPEAFHILKTMNVMEEKVSNE
jgi:hypothetical protein